MRQRNQSNPTNDGTSQEHNTHCYLTLRKHGDRLSEISDTSNTETQLRDGQLSDTTHYILEQIHTHTHTHAQLNTNTCVTTNCESCTACVCLSQYERQRVSRTPAQFINALSYFTIIIASIYFNLKYFIQCILQCQLHHIGLFFSSSLLFHTIFIMHCFNCTQ